VTTEKRTGQSSFPGTDRAVPSKLNRRQVRRRDSIPPLPCLPHTYTDLKSTNLIEPQVSDHDRARMHVERQQV
jgi:hypothetical protein